MKHLKALNTYFYRYKGLLILGIVFTAVSNLMAVLAPQVIQYLVDLMGRAGVMHGAAGHASGEIGFLRFCFGWTGHLNTMQVIAYGGALLLALALLRGFFMFLMRQTLIVMSRHIEFDLKNTVYNHYQQLDLQFFRLHSTGDLMSRITEDVSRVRMYVGPALMYSVNLIVLIVMSIYTMLRVSVPLTLYTLAPMPLLALTIYYVNKIIHRKSERIQAQLAAITTAAQESYSGIRVIKSYTQEEAVSQHFEQASEQYRSSSVNLAMTESFYFPAMTLMIGLSTLITILIGGIQAIHGTITIGNVTEFVVYVNMLMWPVASIGAVTSMIQRASASQKRLNEFLDTRPVILSPKAGKDLLLQGQITFKDIRFTYPHTGIQALNHFNFSVQPGEKVAIIGRTGSGKSTIAQLLIRMYDPQEGQVLIDGVDVRQISLESLRRQISYVPQDVFLFSDTIANNIRFGDAGKSNDAIRHAARLASVEKDILEFPQGFDTPVGERGVTLSGGQKQRVSIARALIKDPRILIFDDCLSAVDARTEKEITGNLQGYLRDKTAIMITHRIFALFDFDRILVLREGEIAEQGTHSSLLAKHGYYATLYAHQQHVDLEQTSGQPAEEAR
ncbi:MAG TPA: ABC transporter ATP-binding protein [Chitinophagaceae bacterium]|nr:ABC transporter ATP-binding protein [Chitinophagaceae bacterium]